MAYSWQIKKPAQESRVPKDKVNEILQQLQRKAIIQLLPSKPKKYAMVNLNQTVINAIEHKKDYLEKTKSELNTLLSNIAVPTRQGNDFWVMEGKSAMVNKIVATLRTVQKESIGFIDIWTARPENLEAIEQAISRGVKFHFLGPVNKKTLPLVKNYEKLGVKVKNYAIRGAEYSVFDGRYVQQRITDGKGVSLWIENIYLAIILREHFFEIWKKTK